MIQENNQESPSYERQIIDAVGRAYLVLDQGGTISYANPAALQMFELSAEAVAVGAAAAGDLGELYPADFWKSELQRIDVIIRRKGQELNLVASTDRCPAGIVLCLETEAGHIEDDFRYFVMDNMSEGVILLDSGGLLLYTNFAANRMLGVGLHQGTQLNPSMESIGEWQPPDFWRQEAYKKEVLFRRGDYEVHFWACIFIKQEKFLICLEEESRTNIKLHQGESLAMMDLTAMVGIGAELRKESMILANSDLSFMITGESGTGKEVMARAIHCTSARAAGPFVVIDCTALPENLIESELFGYEPGTFTGAKRDGRAGKFEIADGGTVMLDEVADLPLSLQPKLLRVLNDHQVMRIGGRKAMTADVRVIACTNRDLGELVERGEFRADLYYRLKGAVLHIPPLRERTQHLDSLIALFLKKHGHGRAYQLDRDAKKLLFTYGWPGNIRELEKAVQIMLVRATGAELTSDLLPPDIARQDVDSVRLSLRDYLNMHERLAIGRALGACQNKVSQTARHLGITKQWLYKRMKQLGIKVPDKIHVRVSRRQGRDDRAEIEIIEAEPRIATPGTRINIHLRITNTGRNPWLDITTAKAVESGKYIVDVYWMRADWIGFVETRECIPLRRQVQCGQTIDVKDHIIAPIRPGEYDVVPNIFHCGVRGFEKTMAYNHVYMHKRFPSIRITIKE